MEAHYKVCVSCFTGLTSTTVISLLTTVVISVLIWIFSEPIAGLFGLEEEAIVATCALGIRVAVTYLFRYSAFLGISIIWWNGLFGFGVGFTVTWIFYLSGKWAKNR